MVKQVVVYDTETGEISQAVVDAFKAANPTAVSTDEGNTATLGTDSLIFVPEGGSGATGLTLELTVVGWSANSQTLTATGVTPTSLLVVAPTPTDQAAYVAAGIICTTQGSGTLTFTCTTTPTAALGVQVVIL